MSRQKRPGVFNLKNLYLIYMKDTKTFERCFVQLIAEKVDASGMKHTEFAKLAFGETSGARIWRKLRSQDEYRALTIEEAYSMAKALKTPFPLLVYDICQEIEKRGLLRQG